MSQTDHNPIIVILNSLILSLVRENQNQAAGQNALESSVLWLMKKTLASYPIILVCFSFIKKKFKTLSVMSTFLTGWLF